MQRIFSSASKIVLLMFALTACAAFLMGKLAAELFVPLATMVLGYYFATAKGGKDDINTDSKGDTV